MVWLNPSQLPPPYPRRLRLVAALVAVVTILVIIWQLLAVLFPFILSGVLAYLLLPFVNLAERRTPWGSRWPRPTRAFTAGLIVVLLLLTLSGVLALGLLRIIDESTALVERAPNLALETQVIYERAIILYENRVPANIREMIDPRIGDLRAALLRGLDDAVLRLLRGLQTGIGLVVSLVTVPIILFYLLFEPDGLGRGAVRLLPESLRGDFTAICSRAGQSIGVYLRVQLLLAAMIGVTTGLSLWALGIQAAPLLAIVAAAGELVPIVGPVISLAIAVVVLLITDIGKTPIVIALYLLLQGAQNTLIVPRLQGQALGLHPLTVVMALAIFGLFLGFWGVLVAAPFTAAGYQVLGYVASEWNTADSPH